MFSCCLLWSIAYLNVLFQLTKVWWSSGNWGLSIDYGKHLGKKLTRILPIWFHGKLLHKWRVLLDKPPLAWDVCTPFLFVSIFLQFIFVRFSFSFGALFVWCLMWENTNWVFRLCYCDVKFITRISIDPFGVHNLKL